MGLSFVGRAGESSKPTRTWAPVAIASAQVLPEDWRSRMVAYASSDYDGPSVDRLCERRRRLVRAYGDSEDAYGEAEYESKLAELDAQIATAQPAPSSNADAVADLIDDLPRLWGRASVIERRALLAPLVQRTYLDLASRRICALAPTAALNP